jgi:CHAT domain-containing protein
VPDVFLPRALATHENAQGPTHPAVASTLSGLATLSDRNGDIIESEHLLQRALALQEQVLGSSHPDVAHSLEQLAAIAQRQSDSTRAILHLTRAYDIRERHFERNLPLGSDRQRAGYLTLFEDDIDQAISLHAHAPASPGAIDLAVTTLLRRKGRALDAASDSVAMLRRHAPADHYALFDRLAAARAQLAAVTLRGPGAASPTAYRANLQRLEDAADRLEAELSAASARFRAESRPITRAAVQGAIPAEAALVEYGLYEPRDPATGQTLLPRYVAYVLAPGNAAPQWADLGEAAAIDAAVGAWRQALRDARRRDVGALARAVDRLVMQPVRDRLGSATHLLISPDGQLNLIPFAALVDERNRYLVEHATITYLTSGRDLLRLQEPRASRNRPVVVAAPAFGEPAVIRSDAFSGARVDPSKVFFGPLPGASDEVRALRQLLPDAAFLTGQDATEAVLRHLAGPRVLHIATHGFFLDGNVGSTTASPQLAGTRLGRWAASVDNPLLRSGLALVGANAGINDDDDGILTALEAASLDLWGTRLVVLSACDTGVGEVKNGQGVYGLRRALVLAGAESQLMSLWPVSDRSTRELMVSYYRQIAAEAGRGDALRRAQLALVRTPRFAHPYYWASFIQSGAWSPLPNEERIDQPSNDGKIVRATPPDLAQWPGCAHQCGGR